MKSVIIDPYRQGILRIFPTAMEHKQFIKEVGIFMHEILHVPPGEDVLAGNSICSDDLNQVQFPNLGNDLGGPFNLGGLAGGIFAGVTGLNAFLHHKPDSSRHVVIFYGPHIGASFNGTGVRLGSVKRIGQKAPSTCCGALVAALARINGMTAPVTPAANDFQYDTITNILFYEKPTLDAIHDMQAKTLKATNIVYAFIENRITTFLRGAHLEPDLKVILIGGIIINVDDSPEISAYFEPKKMSTFQQTASGCEETDIAEKYTVWAVEDRKKQEAGDKQ